MTGNFLSSKKTCQLDNWYKQKPMTELGMLKGYMSKRGINTSTDCGDYVQVFGGLEKNSFKPSLFCFIAFYLCIIYKLKNKQTIGVCLRGKAPLIKWQNTKLKPPGKLVYSKLILDVCFFLFQHIQMCQRTNVICCLSAMKSGKSDNDLCFRGKLYVNDCQEWTCQSERSRWVSVQNCDLHHR